MKKNEIIVDRVLNGNCPICDKPLKPEDSQTDYYDGFKVNICTTHNIKLLQKG